jgi:hypothetical protein
MRMVPSNSKDLLLEPESVRRWEKIVGFLLGEWIFCRRIPAAIWLNTPENERN